MKKIFLTLCAAAACTWLGQAQQMPNPFGGGEIGAERNLNISSYQSVTDQNATPNTLTLSREKMTSSPITYSVADPSVAPKKKQKVTSADLTGLLGEKIVWTTKATDHALALTKTTIALKEGNTYTATPFVYSDVAIEFTVDPATGVVTIPVQKLLTLDGGNVVSLCKVDLIKGVFSATDPVTGVIAEDGSIHINESFGFFVTAGPSVGAYLTGGLFKHGVIANSNASFTNNAIKFDGSEQTVTNRFIEKTTNEAYTYMSSDSKLRILGVPVLRSSTSVTYGEMTATLRPGNVVVIEPQPAYIYSIIGEYYFYSVTEKQEAGKVSFSISPISPIQTTYSETDKTITLASWGVARTNSMLGANASSVIQLPSALTFPTAPQLSLTGDGTESNPYLIKTAQDFATLGYEVMNNASVRSTKELNPDSNTDYNYPVYKGKYFKLANDIDFATLKDPFSPIGDKTYQFAGILDGDGHKISNLKIEEYPYDYCGLFSVTSQYSEIKNINFENPQITSIGYTAGVVAGRSYGSIHDLTITNPYISVRAGYNVGAVAGYAYKVDKVTVSGAKISSLGYNGGIAGRCYSSITNCSVQGSLSQGGAQTFTGGIVGHMTKYYTESPSSVLSNCAFTGTITCTTDQIGLGGIAGAFSYSNMTECYANAVIQAVSDRECSMGGIVGNSFQASITDCYVSGFVRNLNTTMAGGILGHVTKSSGTSIDNTTTLTNCYSSVMLETGSTAANRGIVGDETATKIVNCYYDAQIANVENETLGLSTEAMTSKDGLKGFSADKWTFTEGTYPRLKASVDSIIADVATAALILPAGQTVKAVEDNFKYSTANGVKWSAIVEGKLNESNGYAFTFNNGVALLTYSQQTDTIFATKGDASKYYLVNIAPVSFEGAGTAEDPWKIQSKEDLARLSSMSVKASLTFKDRYMLQTADIDMEGMEIDPICKDATAKIQFLGNYDGGNHVINNLKIQSVGFYTAEDVTGTAVVGQVNPKSTKTYNYGGLFATIGAEGIVKNVRIGSGCSYDLFFYGGAVAANLYGTIENCYNYANVKCYNQYVGGIVGMAQKGSKVTGCYNDGTIEVNNANGGGIVGNATSATIENCENTGYIHAYNFNPYQKPNIQSKAGGIAGTATSCTINNVVNSGKVSAYDTAGGIVGVASGTAAAPGSVSNALNYGFIYSINTPLTRGAISGTNSFNNYANCYTDTRLQHIGLAANGNVDGVSGLPTEELIGNAKLFASADNWNIAEKAYPSVKLATVPAQVTLNSTAYINFSGNNFAEAVTSNATLTTGATWTVASETSAFAVDADLLKVTTPAEGTAETELTATLNGCSRTFPLKSFKYAIFKGDGSETNPYLIEKADDFLALSELVNTTGFNYAGLYFSQTADLDFAGKKFTPVGYGGRSFGGVYNGNKHVMKSVNFANATTDKTVVTGGLFSILDATGVVCDLTLDENSAIATQSYAAGIAAYLYGEINNCVNKAAVSTYGTTNAGGITAYAYPGAKIIGCSNTGAVTAKTNYAGGILGSSAAQSRIVITDCSNEGVVTGAAKNGGIVGSGSVVITKVTNSGKITSTTNYAGGVIGEALLPSTITTATNSGEITTPQYGAGVTAMATAHNATTPFTMVDCHNTANLTAGAKGYFGGVAGSIGNYSTFIKCDNTGDIIGSDASGCIRLGGVVGTAGTYATLDSCYNTGKVITFSNSAGVIGAASGNSSVTHCYNTGEITGYATSATGGNIGGVIGNASSPMILNYCYNTGNITVEKGGAVGGVGGAANGNYDSEVYECYNTGNILGAGYVGGIAGTLRAKTKNCVNYGTVTGGNGTAGIGGFPYNAAATSYTVTVDSCVNVGKIISTNANSAAIVGKNASCKYLIVGVNFYDKDVFDATAIDKELSPKAVGLTTRELAELKLDKEFENKDYCYPILKYAVNEPACAFNAALMLLAEGETAEKVTKDFNVGILPVVKWTASDNLSISENGTVSIKETRATESETAWVNKNAGDLNQKYELTIIRTSSLVNELDADADLVKVVYITLDGRVVETPQPGMILIRRAFYRDGKVNATKVLITSDSQLD